MTSLKEELKTESSFPSHQQEAFLSILVTSDRLSRLHADFMARYGITPKHYNVLRILRGAGRCGLPIMEIAKRMIERAPDITRIIQRLLDKGFLSKRRSRCDKRVVKVFIVAKGRKILTEMDESVAAQVEGMLLDLEDDELIELIYLLEKVRSSAYRHPFG